MNDILTAAGVALCTTLLGTPSPTYKNCENAIFTARPPVDYFFKSPTLNEYCPDDQQNCEYKKWPHCLAWATYDIYDGSKGTVYFCHRDAKLIWLPDGRWSWELNEKKP